MILEEAFCTAKSNAFKTVNLQVFPKTGTVGYFLFILFTYLFV